MWPVGIAEGSRGGLRGGSDETEAAKKARQKRQSEDIRGGGFRESNPGPLAANADVRRRHTLSEYYATKPNPRNSGCARVAQVML
jgi:hypothetical protein